MDNKSNENGELIVYKNNYYLHFLFFKFIFFSKLILEINSQSSEIISVPKILQNS